MFVLCNFRLYSFVPLSFGKGSLGFCKVVCLARCWTAGADDHLLRDVLSTVICNNGIHKGFAAFPCPKRNSIKQGSNRAIQSFPLLFF